MAAAPPAPLTTTTTEVSADVVSQAGADMDSPSSLLTSADIRITPLGLVGKKPSSSDSTSGSSSSSTNAVYSAAKAKHLVRSAVQLYVGTIEHYLALRTATAVSTSAVVQQWQWQGSACVLLAAGAAEGLSNLAFSVGPAAFEVHIKQVHT